MTQNNAINVTLTSIINITNAQLKSMSTTPVELVAAPGAGYMIAPLFVFASYIYGGNNALTGGGSCNVYYGNKAFNAAVLFVVASMNGTANRYSTSPGSQGSLGINGTSPDNLALTLSQTGADYGGNANNDNTMTIKVMYRIIPTA